MYAHPRTHPGLTLHPDSHPRAGWGNVGTGHERGVLQQQERGASDCLDVLECSNTWVGPTEGRESAQRAEYGSAHVGHLFSPPRAQRELAKIQLTRLGETSQHHKGGSRAEKTQPS